MDSKTGVGSDLTGTHDALDNTASAEWDAVERSVRARQRRYVILTGFVSVALIAVLATMAWKIGSKRRELAALAQTVAAAQEEKRRLDEEIVHRRAEIATLKNEKAGLARDNDQLTAYVAKIRGALDNKGKVSEVKGVDFKPRVAVASSGSTDFPYRVDLWTEVPLASQIDIEGVTYDLDPRFYPRRPSATEDSPAKRVQFIVGSCESKVLISIRLKDGQGSIVLDFDWCNTDEWRSARRHN